MARSRRSFGGQKARHGLKQWTGPADQGYVLVGSGAQVLLASAAFSDPATILRTRGMVSVKPQAVTADIEIIGAFGMCIVTDEAFAAGAAAVPDVFDDGGWSGWFVWQSFCYDFEFNDATGINFPTWNFEVDSKAMRKIGPNETVVLTASSQSGAFAICSPLRFLTMLS